jgi:dienelactone hydrolase
LRLITTLLKKPIMRTVRRVAKFFTAILFACAAAVHAQTPVVPAGEIKGSAWSHTPSSLVGLVQQADVVLPASANAGLVFVGKFKDMPTLKSRNVPTVLFMHGSSGLSLKAIAEWQLWLASLGVASVAPDSYALPDRVTYKSPIDKDSYEKIHALRVSEVAPMLSAIKALPWVDSSRLVLAGSSEGSVAVARYTGSEFAARIIFAWSCEGNYFVREPKNALETDKPVLNVISTVDPFFSQSNPWIGNALATGHCGDALKDNKRASIVLIPGAPHTLLNMPAARDSASGFLRIVLKL